MPLLNMIRGLQYIITPFDYTHFFLNILKFIYNKLFQLHSKYNINIHKINK